MERLSEYNNIDLEKDGCIYDKKDVLNLYRLQKQLLIEENIIASLIECLNIWQTYSFDLSASWLSFPESDDAILKYIKSSNFFTSFEEYSK